MADTVTLTVDGDALSVPPGTLIVDAARQAGVEVPVFCHHPRLAPLGTCGMCRVEVGLPALEDGQPVVRWLPDLQRACTTPVSEGMVVRTQSERVARARQETLASLLAHHPLDCPVCDKDGECLLQNYVMAYTEGVAHQEHNSRTGATCDIPLGDLMVLNLARCIQCGRCVRFQAEIVGAHDPAQQSAYSADPCSGHLQAEIAGRRDPAQQSAHSADPCSTLDSYWSGNTSDICPVGALIPRDFHLSARPWELARHASLCHHCTAGCNVALQTCVEALGHSAGHWVIKRVVPRQNEKVNGMWICDKGRYAHHHTRAADRLTVPLVREDGALVEATWDEALDLIVRHLGLVSPHQVSGVAGDRLSNEDLFLFQALMRDVIGTPHVNAYPNAPGADLVARYGIGVGSDWRRLDRDSVILVVAGDVQEQVPAWFLWFKAAAQRGARVITVNGRATALDRYATHHLRVRYGSAPHLLLGLTRLLLENGESPSFIKLQANLSGFGPDAIERLTGVTATALQAAAKTFGRAEDAIVVFGREGLSDYGALALVQAAANLLLATGHVGRANNGLLPLWPHNNTQGAADVGVRPDAGPGYQEIIEHGWRFDSMLSAVRSRSIRLMWVAGADLVGDDPSTAQALEALDFLVVQELFLSDTARRADVVLPALSFAERDGTYTSGDRRVQRFERALPPLGQGRADWAILAEVARRLGADWTFDSSASVLAALNVALPQYDGGLGRRWQTASEREDVGRVFEWVELPTWQDAELVAVSVRWLYRHGTLVSRSPVLRGRLRGAVVEFNPHDAARLGLSEDVPVSASLGGQTIELSVRLNPHAPKGIVLVPSGLLTGPLTVRPTFALSRGET
jgi:NADH-quinone oxidoreductase subunit G